jgi:hypothetical protein
MKIFPNLQNTGTLDENSHSHNSVKSVVRGHNPQATHKFSFLDFSL